MYLTRILSALFSALLVVAAVALCLLHAADPAKPGVRAIQVRYWIASAMCFAGPIKSLSSLRELRSRTNAVHFK